MSSHGKGRKTTSNMMTKGKVKTPKKNILSENGAIITPFNL
jgi:hypothetical protein